jgi:hypothetical protein
LTVGYYGVAVLVSSVVIFVLVFPALVFLIFLVFVVVAGAASSANTGIASEKITIDANRTVKSFFMVGLDLLRLFVRHQ